MLNIECLFWRKVYSSVGEHYVAFPGFQFLGGQQCKRVSPETLEGNPLLF